MRKPNRLRSMAVNGGLFLFSALFILLLIEGVLRFTPYKNLLLPNQGAYPPHYFRTDSAKGYDLSENFKKSKAYVNTELEYEVWSNELGCFDRSYAGEKNPILLVGDSFAQMYAPYEEKWGTWVEKLLDRRVLKCGVSGYGTKQALLKAKEVVSKIQSPPSLILLGYHLNDLKDDYVFPQFSVVDGSLVTQSRIKQMRTGQIETNRNLEKTYRLFQSYGTSAPPRLPWIQKIKNGIDRHSILLNMTRPLVEGFPYPLRIERFLKQKEILTENTNAVAFYDYPWLNEAWKKHLENLREFKKFAEGIGAAFVVVIIPAKEQLPPLALDYTFDENPDLEKPNRTLTRFFKEEGIAFIDLLPLLKGSSRPKDLYWKRDGHWNIQGNHFAGLVLSKFLLEENWVKIENREGKQAALQEQLAKFQ